MAMLAACGASLRVEVGGEAGTPLRHIDTDKERAVKMGEKKNGAKPHC